MLSIRHQRNFDRQFSRHHPTLVLEIEPLAFRAKQSEELDRTESAQATADTKA